MSSSTPQELSASAVIQRIGTGEYGRDVVVTIARGFLPLPQEELIAVLAFLASSSDAEVANLAHDSLREIPSRSLLTFATNERNAPEHLAFLTRATEDIGMLEALIRNRSLPDESLVELAGHADPIVQEIIVINQARIIKAPQILDALMSNPRIAPDVRRRALETREEFFDKKARLEKLAEEEVADFLDDDPIADLLDKAQQEDVAGPQTVSPAMREVIESTDPDRRPIFAKILTMSVSEKVKLAFKGGRTERMILIRDRNRLICSAVMRNPRMTDSEAESIAGMRNVDEEVLRLLTTRRDFISKYGVMANLARNPKAPIGVVLPLINRLTLRDLKGLKDDKGVSETVRSTARKLYQQRGQKS
ncbi:MAG TPA: hypothetical protein VL284_18730 [Thermoanaerobaculia bacterium]|nr:hypothetical protein [Thermoanaerobaculia bacterium]